MNTSRLLVWAPRLVCKWVMNELVEALRHLGPSPPHNTLLGDTSPLDVAHVVEPADFLQSHHVTQCVPRELSQDVRDFQVVFVLANGRPTSDDCRAPGCVALSARRRRRI